jgi:uncharacterized protein (DUF952 family)
VADLFHIALRADWEHARETGSYRVSTLGRSLEEDGFIHLSYADQWAGVLAAGYADVDAPLVLLEVDPGRLDAPVVEEDGFPHLYGELPMAAVVVAQPLR